MREAKPTHDCIDYSIHGLLAERFYKAPIEVCMKCNRWRSIRYEVYEWQPWDTMNTWIKEYRQRTGR